MGNGREIDIEERKRREERRIWKGGKRTKGVHGE